MGNKVGEVLHHLMLIALFNFLVIVIPVGMYYDYQTKLAVKGWGHSIISLCDIDFSIRKSGVTFNIRPYQDCFYRLKEESDYRIMKYEQMKAEAVKKGFGKYNQKTGKFEWTENEQTKTTD